MFGAQINAVGTVDDIFKQVVPIFSSFEVYTLVLSAIISFELSIYAFKSPAIIISTRFVLITCNLLCSN